MAGPKPRAAPLSSARKAVMKDTSVQVALMALHAGNGSIFGSRSRGLWELEDGGISVWGKVSIFCRGLG